MEYAAATMQIRDELKTLIDKLPESSLEGIRSFLNFHINPPPPPPPEVERMRQRGQAYRREVERRFRETLKPATIGSFVSGGSWDAHEGIPFGRNSFNYWEDKALVQQSLQSFDEQDVEIMERYALSEDGTKLVCTIELSSGGHTVRHEDEFPISPETRNPKLET